MKHLSHSVYQKTVSEKLAQWRRRQARPLKPEWAEAALLLWRINLDPVRPLLASLYSPSPRGRPPYDPVCVLRALLLMTRLRVRRIDRFADGLRRSPRLALIAGFEPFKTPAEGCHWSLVIGHWQRTKDKGQRTADPGSV